MSDPLPDADAALAALETAAARIEQQALDNSYADHLLPELRAAAKSAAALLVPDRPAAATAEVVRRAAAHLAVGRAWYALQQRDDAARHLSAALAQYRELARDDPERWQCLVARCLTLLAKPVIELGRNDEGTAMAGEAADWLAAHAAEDPGAREPDLAQAWHSMGLASANLGDIQQALTYTERGLEIRQRLAARDPMGLRAALWASLQNRGNWLAALGSTDEAVRSFEQAAEVARLWAAKGTVIPREKLTATLESLRSLFEKVGRRAEAIDTASKVVLLYRELVALNRPLFLSEYASRLNDLGNLLGRAGRPAEALEAAQEAVALYRELVTVNRPAFLSNLAMSRNNQGVWLSGSGRRTEALEAAREAVWLSRELVATQSPTFLPDLAMSLLNLSIRLDKVGRRERAMAAAVEAAELYRRLLAENQAAFMSDFAASLNQLANTLSCPAEALQAADEAVKLCRELVVASRPAFLPDLAGSLLNLGVVLGETGHRTEALKVAQEAAELYRELVSTSRSAFLPDLTMSLNNLGVSLSGAGHRAEALGAFRECGALLLEWRPTDPHRWAELARGPMRVLHTAHDLRCWHLPLLRQLAEHRELAWDSTHAELILTLQTEVAGRIWDILTTLGPGDAGLVDEAIAALVATLQSPDLARWLQVQVMPDVPGGADGNGAGRAVELPRLIRAVMDAERVLDALLVQLRHQDDGGPGGLTDGRSSVAAPADQAEQARKRREFRKRLETEIARHSAEALEARDAYRAGRTRLIESDPKLRSTFTLPTAQTLRQAAAHSKGQALLCLLDLPRLDGVTGPGDKAAPRRIVGALLPADGGPARLLEFPGVETLAQKAAEYVPAGERGARLGALRGATQPDASHSPPEEDSETADHGSAPPPADPSPWTRDQLAQRLREHFQAPLQEALREALPAAEGQPLRVHLCLHGLTQQLPLALLDEPQCGAGPDLLVWPGLPYLRLAAASAARPYAAHASDGPWIVGHDCAWGTRQPLPMVAVEAELLVMLLCQFGQPVQRIGPEDTIAVRARALVACCHGSHGGHGDVQQPAHFDHRLHLGAQPLTAGRIMDEHLGPAVTLLPACFAGRIDEDGAGNALGVCAAFMLSGTRLASGSTKPVPDLLQPWLTTLTVWHLLHGGMTPRQAALKAREQFAKLAFPDDYKDWLRQALPAALATIQPLGQEAEKIRGPWPMRAMQKTREFWPWEGQTLHLFSDNRQQREQATRSVVEGVLVPRGSDAGARELAAIARDMAAFVAVYGSD